MDVQALQLADDEWSTLQQIQKVLQPFWDHTNTVSNGCPTIVDSLPIYWNLDDLLNDVKLAEGSFEGVDEDIRHAVEGAIKKMNKQMSGPDAELVIGQVRDFLKKEYPFDPVLPCNTGRPAGMSEAMWRTLKKVQPAQQMLISDVDRYLDSKPVNWSQSLIENGDPEWVLKWWKANAFDFPLMAQAVRDYLPVPSAEVGVERVFSGARDVLGLRRQSMNAETMRWLVLLKGEYDNTRQL
jgi:hypothetical protein